tara:strand:+ start:1538 stop:1762 length:225 start_codon:yes stop_codon:yes gene_type:complete
MKTNSYKPIKSKVMKKGKHGLRKLKVSTKVHGRDFKQAEGHVKLGVVIVSTIILPCLVMILSNVAQGAHISFGY